MLTREEFADYFNEVAPGKLLGSADSPLWIPEDNANARCEWFMCVKPVIMRAGSKDKLDFWLWCTTNLTGIVRCFSSNTDDQEEWWGFQNQSDISIWMLKWA